jgi:uncharacterized protein (TIGR00297 family)
MGKQFGSTTYLISSGKIVPKGTEGAVSIEGTIFGFIGACFMSVFGAALRIYSWKSTPVVALSAWLATLAESYIGETLQQASYALLSNEFVNFLCTLIASIFAISYTSVSEALSWNI